MPNEKVREKDTNDTLSKVVGKIENANNILVAVSKDPTADELSAALGLTLMLDEMGKHATAIYSGKTPDALHFLKPEKTFESNTNSLQDFIIALDKEKADHLRYKVDGGFVKVFITPYKTTIDESDLEFSHGDFNVDLVIALNVPTVDDLDAALYEHGRIMHDAGSVNITNGVPGKFGEIEWSDQSVSSVSEMVTNLAYGMKGEYKIDKSVATALLTGIVANTDRFLNDNTTPGTMDVAGKLMQAGANQKLISSSFEDALKKQEEEKEEEELEGGLSVEKGGSEAANELDLGIKRKNANSESLALDELAEQAALGNGDKDAKDGDGMNELDVKKEENETGGLTSEDQLNQMIAQPVTDASAMADLEPKGADAKESSSDGTDSGQGHTVIDDLYPKVDGPVSGVDREAGIKAPEFERKDYGQMMEDAMTETLPNPAAQATPVAPTGPELNHIPNMDYVPHAQTTPVTVPVMGNEYLTTNGVTAASGVTSGAAPETQPVMPEAMTQQPMGMPEMAQPAMPEMQQPAMPEIPQSQPAAMPEIPQPVMPETMAQQSMGAPEVAQPVMPEMQQPMMAPDQMMIPQVPQQSVESMPASQPGQTVSQLEQANDPSAFKIPGM